MFTNSYYYYHLSALNVIPLFSILYSTNFYSVICCCFFIYNFIPVTNCLLRMNKEKKLHFSRPPFPPKINEKENRSVVSEYEKKCSNINCLPS